VKGIFNFINKNTREGRQYRQQLTAYTWSSCTSDFTGSTSVCWKLFFLHLVYSAILAMFGEVFLLLKTTASLLVLGHYEDVTLGTTAAIWHL
jgi:hypothetical protein